MPTFPPPTTVCASYFRALAGGGSAAPPVQRVVVAGRHRGTPLLSLFVYPPTIGFFQTRRKPQAMRECTEGIPEYFRAPVETCTGQWRLYNYILLHQ